MPAQPADIPYLQVLAAENFPGADVTALAIKFCLSPEVGCRPPGGNVRYSALEAEHAPKSAIADATARRSVAYLPILSARAVKSAGNFPTKMVLGFRRLTIGKAMDKSGFADSTKYAVEPGNRTNCNFPRPRGQ